jgi:hypothetical protein
MSKDGTQWTPDEIIAEAKRLMTSGGNPRNARSDLQTALGMIQGLAWLVKPQYERDRETNPPPKQYGE